MDDDGGCWVSSRDVVEVVSLCWRSNGVRVIVAPCGLVGLRQGSRFRLFVMLLVSTTPSPNAACRASRVRLTARSLCPVPFRQRVRRLVFLIVLEWITGRPRKTRSLWQYCRLIELLSLATA